MISVLTRLFYRLCGIPIGSDFKMRGFPLVRKGGARSQIRIGRRLHAVSSPLFNPIGVPNRIMIRTIANDAVIQIGDDVGLSGCVISAAKSIVIGNRVLIGSGALIMDSDQHPLDPVERKQNPYSKGRCATVVIEDDAFIGARAIILKGVTIGKGAVIGAGAVVSHDVPAGSIVSDNPAVILRSRGSQTRKDFA